jgi:hypothetical protein
VRWVARWCCCTRNSLAKSVAISFTF